MLKDLAEQLENTMPDLNLPDDSNIPIDMEFEYVPGNPYAIQGEIEGGGESQFLPGNESEKSFWKGYKAELYEFNTTAQLAHGSYDRFIDRPNPLDDSVPPDWDAHNPDILVNVRPQYIPYMTEATGPKDQQYRLQRVMFEQNHEDNLANGTWMGRILGGLTGIVTDPISYVPIAGWAKYAKFAPTVLKSAARAFPGIAAMGVLQSVARQTDKVNGNLQDFFVDSMVNTVFGSVLFGGLGAGSLVIEKMNLWNLRGIARNYIDGIDFKLAQNEKGRVIGLEAVDSTGNLSAAQVNIAQQLADSAYHQGGLFKVPYIGQATFKVLAHMPFLGSTLLKMMDSPFPAVQLAINRIADHGVITKGVAEGKAAAPKFSSLMNQEYAELRALEAQAVALHNEMNGYTSTIRPLNGLVNLGSQIKSATIDNLDSIYQGKKSFTRFEFFDEVDRVLRTENASKFSPVNEFAAMLAKKRDQIWADYRLSEKLPDDWLPPRMSKGHSMRVYNTEMMNNKENEWIEVISKSYAETDAFIQTKMQPITEIEQRIKQLEENHFSLKTNKEIKNSSDLIDLLKNRRVGLQNNLQDELRTNTDLHDYIEDWHALSYTESKQLESLLSPSNEIKKEIDDLKNSLTKITEISSRKKSSILKAKTLETHEKQSVLLEKNKQEQLIINNKIKELEDKLFIEEKNLQIKIDLGEVNPRFYYKIKGSERYAFTDPNRRLKFVKPIANDTERKILAKVQYNSIMNQTAEDTIDQVLGRYVSKSVGGETTTLSRTVMVPDEVLYDNNFMSKDLMAKFSNYVTFLARRTHLKNVFGDLSEEGGIEPLLNTLHNQHEGFRSVINERLLVLKNSIKNPELTDKEKNALEKKVSFNEKQLKKKRVQFENGKKQLNHLYAKMMGKSSYSYDERKWQRGIMAVTAIANLPFVPFLMLNDLSNIVFKTGLASFIRDSVSPMITSFGGILKTKNSEAFRKSASSVHLALQDISMGYADRNWSMQTNPYVNMGRIVNSLEWLAHKSSNFTLTNYADNYLQRMAASGHQSEFMRILNAYKKGTMTEKEGIYLRKYGLDPKKWSERMNKAFKESGGKKGVLGGYNSRFWTWKDLEASNEFGDSLFRAVKDTIIQRDIADAPMWADNPIGALVFGFQGWAFASINRFVIPSMQEPDARKLIGVITSLLSGAMVDPVRRMARGEDPTPPNQTTEQFVFAAIQNSGYFSYFNNIISDINVLTGDKLLGNLKNDRYHDRTRIGLVGPAWGTMNRMFDIISALGTGEFNKADARKMARMLPFANATWTYWLSKKLIDGLDIPDTRAQAAR